MLQLWMRDGMGALGVSTLIMAKLGKSQPKPGFILQMRDENR